MMIPIFEGLARYNRGANARLYSACAELDESERLRDRGAFFGSIHRTLNHILVGDRIWMARFEGGSAPSTDLDAILFEDFPGLRRARAQEDERIERYTAGLDASALEAQLDYINNTGHRFRDPLAMLLSHFFNHQTHHRGQVHCMLTQAGAKGPVLDLHRVLVPDPTGRRPDTPSGSG